MPVVSVKIGDVDHVQVGDYSGVRGSRPLKRDEEGDEEGDVDEDDHRVDGSTGGTPVLPRGRGRKSPHVFPPPWPLP